LEFHLMIAQACRNRVMTKILESLRGPVQQLITDIYAVSPDSLEQSTLEHKEILDAIAIHEVEKAQERMEAHLQTSKRLIERYYRFKDIDVL
jgi:DNA-binding GntR family transcriptional regulator